MYATLNCAKNDQLNMGLLAADIINEQCVELLPARNTMALVTTAILDALGLQLVHNVDTPIPEL